MENAALIIEYIEETCSHRPNVIAVHDEGTGEQITYQQLAEKYSIISRQIIRRINYDRYKESSSSPLISIITNKNIASIIGTLSILHAHCVFVPIDPDLPELCQIQILQQSRCDLLIVDEDNMLKIRTYPLSILPPLIILDRNGNLKDLSPCETYRFTTFPVKKDPLMYVIYKNEEEGGKPQGVMVTNQGILNILKYFISYLRLKDYDRVLSLMPLSCDASIVEIFTPLLIGSTLYLGSQATAEDPIRLMNVLDTLSITFLQGTVRMFEALLDNDWEGNKNLQLMIAMGGGNGGYSSSSSSKSHVSVEGSRLLEEMRLPSRLYSLVKMCRQVYTVYGSSETSIWSSCHWLENDIEPKYPDSLLKSLLPSNIPTTQYYLGQPIHHTQFYILNKRLQPVKPGQLGELYISGKSLSKGYLYDSALTKSKFIKNPFNNKKGSGNKLYKTGICCIKIRNSDLTNWEYLCINGLNPDIALQEGMIALTMDWYRSVTSDITSWTSSILSSIGSPKSSRFTFPFSTSSKPVLPISDASAELPKQNISSFTSVTTQGTDQTSASNMSTAVNAPTKVAAASSPKARSVKTASSTPDHQTTVHPPQTMTRNRRRSSILKKTLIIPAGHFYNYSSSALAKEEEEKFLLEQAEAAKNPVKSNIKTVQIREDLIQEQEDDDDDEEEEEEEDENNDEQQPPAEEVIEAPPVGVERSPSFKRQRSATFVYTPSPYNSRNNSIMSPQAVTTTSSPDRYGSMKTNFSSSIDSPDARQIPQKPSSSIFA